MDLHPSSSSFSYAFTYDVFLSFRGSDTRHSFTGNLYKALCYKGIHTFIDDEELQRGDEITPALVKAIQESRIAIPVFSINYASSSFCLDELVTIIDYIKTKGRLVFPVFYNVDPSYVRHQSGTYGKALAKHKARFKNNKEKLEDNMKRLQKWKTALTQVANLSGYHYKLGDGYEHEFIGKIVEEVSRKINRVLLHVADYPVGLDVQVLKVKSLLDVGSDNGVHMIGIHGIGGGGKTTLALAIYNSIADYFEGLCFLENVRENSNKQGLQHLQSIILSEIVGENKIKLTSVKQGMSMIKHRLQTKKVLLILDDVDKKEQLQALVGGLDWFGPGSRIIITTRDQQLLARNNVKRTYEVKLLNEEDALQLLSWNAFKSERVDPSYVNVLNRVITYASGLPLALEVIGSNLYGKSIKEWESAINQYERIPNNEILKILNISFGALGEEEKNVFLDIACCFKGYDLEEVKDILHAHQGYCVEHHIGVLVDKSLVKIGSKDVVTLHDLIEDMAKEIIRQESPKEPGERSRLWFYEDIVQVLKDNKGTGKIEIIYLQFPLPEEDEREIEWDGDAFKEMKNLKTLIIRNGRFLKGPKHLPNSLRVLEWKRYPLQNLPDDFHPKKLVIWKFPFSCLVSEGLILRKANKLKILRAEDCFNLKTFPPMKLTSLEVLNLSYSGLESFPEVLGKMPNLKEVDLHAVPIKKIPHSFQNLIGLEAITMDFPMKLSDSEEDDVLQNIVTMPKLTVIKSFNRVLHPLLSGYVDEDKVSSSNIQIVYLKSCKLTDEYFLKIVKFFANVKELFLQRNNFIIVPECIKECIFLKKLDLSDCKSLQEIRGIPPNLKYFYAQGCNSLTSSCRRMLLNQDLHGAGNTVFILPETEIPEWFEHRSRGTPISFWFRNKLPALVLYFGMASNYPFEAYKPTLLVNGREFLLYSRMFIRKRDRSILVMDLRMHLGNGYHIYLENEWNRAEVRYQVYDHTQTATSEIGIQVIPTLREFGIHVLKQEYSMEDIRFTDPYEKRKLEDDLNSSVPENNQFLKKQKFVDMEICKTQFEMQRQRMGLLWRMWNWVRNCFPFLPALPMHSLDDNVNEDLSSMTSTQIRDNTGVRGEADGETTEEGILDHDNRV
ncbi:hypothetical protein VNO77_02062 [Canavalia gladiata]|uniref:TIR domain-containing protein n=1 Tax=Canavalia gladiata TaxID=3824 RepID=A0AAN9MUB1_CANGL